ncbi:2-trimethylaminoethylphosphonate dioxygenase [Vreelandella sp. EE22]
MSQTITAALFDQGRRLRITQGDDYHDYLPVWLRERAPDADTLDPTTGQRLIEAAKLPLDLRVEAARIEADDIQLTFSDQHQTTFPVAALAPTAQGAKPGLASETLTLWDSTLQQVPQAAFDEALKDDAALGKMLEALYRVGFVLVSNVPTTEDGMQALIDRIGPLRRTNWGGIADVKSVANAYDLTMTQRGLEPHTDNPYRDPIPGYIWLHCLSNAADGGDSTLVDGFMAAQRLKEEDPAAFECLTRLAPRFEYVDGDTHLESEGPLIELDSHGRLKRVRFSNRTERIEALAPALLNEYYAARQRFFELITSEVLTVHLKLNPGQMLIMDNYRLLHGRQAFQLEGGVRHMRQGYVDRDSTASRREVLKKRLDATRTQGATP